VRAAANDPDLLLIASMREPPALDDARSSLDYWRQRRSRLPIYRVGARREASLMIGRWQARVVEAERRRYGTGIAGLVRRLLAGDASSWWLGASGLRGLVWRVVPRRLVVLGVAAVTAWLVVCALALAALASLIT
jgi:hypothetical protein